MKNTMGTAELAARPQQPGRHARPFDDRQRGHLGFVAEAVFRTVEIHQHAATGLLILPGLTDATDALPALLAAGARTAELLDAAALRVSQRDPDASPALRGLTVTGHAALLVEFAEDSAERLAATLPTPGRCSTGCPPSPAPT
ncbi:FAD-linked oxidase C-terminal domain-containing protein [Micromonospora sp. M12]